jgi:hypothetical protein
MSDDYLWDKSGETDPEIEELEQLLGNLRYRRPAGDLALPKKTPLRAPRNFTHVFAVAAALLLAIAAAGVWFVLGVGSRIENRGVLALKAEPGRAQDWLNPQSLSAITTQPANEATAREHTFVATGSSRADKPQRSVGLKRRESSQGQLARSSSPKRSEVIDYDEGVAAREQLIRALHLASSKLNRVQKKMQDNKSTGPVS